MKVDTKTKITLVETEMVALEQAKNILFNIIHEIEDAGDVDIYDDGGNVLNSDDIYRAYDSLVGITWF